MSEEQQYEVIAQEWVILFDGKIKKSEKKLYLKSNSINSEKENK